ncbi:hypothetical protein SO802_018034 [Lithocarpus litseifolius]|uniref:Uncharacterized protein n=1 Tax=Lithocarpus litseifolius TaxID=425828 RepID=A0AAW2CJL1_9ROSI
MLLSLNTMAVSCVFQHVSACTWSFLNSAFELLLRVWAVSWDLKVRISSAEALGQMVGLIAWTKLKSALPRLVPTFLELYKKDHDIAFMATCSLHNLLNASLLSESGPPLLDFRVTCEKWKTFDRTEENVPRNMIPCS